MLAMFQAALALCAISLVTSQQLESKTEDGEKCLALVSSALGNSSVECMFPFTYNGVTYTSCATVYNNDVPWCQVREINEETPDNLPWYGNCQEHCKVDQRCLGERWRQKDGKTDKPCVFPFVFRGVEYDGCTTVHSSDPWCSTTQVAEGEFYEDKEGSWGFCTSNCRLANFCSSTKSPAKKDGNN